jgi:hypothetical protein
MLPGLGMFFQGFIIFVIEAVILGIVSAQRRLGEWLAGYAGVVLGSAPFFVLCHHYYATACGWGSCPPSPAVLDLLFFGAGEALILVAPVAGVVFLVIGDIRLVARRGRRNLPPRPGSARGRWRRGARLTRRSAGQASPRRAGLASVHSAPPPLRVLRSSRRVGRAPGDRGCFTTDASCQLAV